MTAYVSVKQSIEQSSNRKCSQIRMLFKTARQVFSVTYLFIRKLFSLIICQCCSAIDDPNAFQVWCSFADWSGSCVFDSLRVHSRSPSGQKSMNATLIFINTSRDTSSEFVFTVCVSQAL